MREASECRTATDTDSYVFYDTEDPLEASSDIFYQNPVDVTLYVPETAIEKCRQIEPWKNFKNIIPYNFAGVKEIDSYLEDSPTIEFYNLNGIKIDSDFENHTSGLYIIRKGKTVKKIKVK